MGVGGASVCSSSVCASVCSSSVCGVCIRTYIGVFGEEQCYVIFETDNAGVDLEHAKVGHPLCGSSAVQWSLRLQCACHSARYTELS